MRKAVVGFSKYEVDEQGQVFGPKGKLKPTTNGKGYLRVFLRRNGATHTRYLHRIVCEAFHGAPPDMTECAHLNGQRDDCRSANLVWATKVENEGHKDLHGTRIYGERASHAVLTEAMVIEARRRASLKEPMKTIAAEFGVHDKVLADAITGRRWKQTGDAVPAFHTRRRVTDEQVREIRDRCARGQRHADVGSDYGISRTAVGAIFRREAYAHVSALEVGGSKVMMCSGVHLNP